MTENAQHDINQIALARTEIKNLRQQISALKHEHHKEIKSIKNLLDGLRCASCAEQATTVVPNQKPVQLVTDNSNGESIVFRPIGVLRTSFYNKRGVPRQASIIADSKGYVEIDTSVFSNPEHAFSGLEEFSHMWIMFHFHVSEASHTLAKVAPPRLDGEKRGVFSTRSPHRPCPIGLSLVKIFKIEGNKIHFIGVDMVNGTPVLDVKPYIPYYDDPAFITDSYSRPQAEGTATCGNISRGTVPVGGDSSNSPACSPSNQTLSPEENTVPDFPPASEARQDERGAPDGQELLGPKTGTVTDGLANVRIAPWISNPPAQIFEVTFTNEAFNRLKELIGDRAEMFKTNIQSLLSEDPRSHYVRTRYPDHLFSCVLEDLSINCLFDAETSLCTIVAVRNAEEMQQT